jgi:hypothetical protein
MTDRTKWIVARVRPGWAFLAVGVLVGIAGVVIGAANAGSPVNFRIITGLGILSIGVGAGYLVRYRAALKDAESARRLMTEARDERTVMIRARAGSRAFWTSATLVYVGLMWSSFAANGGLPPLDGDTLWYFLATAVVVPFAIYVGSILVDERTL